MYQCFINRFSPFRHRPLVPTHMRRFRWAFVYDEWMCSIDCFIDRLSIFWFRPIIYRQLTSSCFLMWPQFPFRWQNVTPIEREDEQFFGGVIYMHIWRQIRDKWISRNIVSEKIDQFFLCWLNCWTTSFQNNVIDSWMIDKHCSNDKNNNNKKCRQIVSNYSDTNFDRYVVKPNNNKSMYSKRKVLCVVYNQKSSTFNST